MKQAIAVLAHKNFCHLEKLLKSFDENFLFYIHIDSASDFTRSEIETIRAYRNVAYVSTKTNINWGSSLIVKNILMLIAEILKDKTIQYAHLISGQDFLIKSSSEITQYLTNNKGKEFIIYFSLPSDVWTEGGLNRIRYYYLFDLLKARTGVLRKLNNFLVWVQKGLGVNRKFLPNGLKIYGGRMWWTLSYGCLEFIKNFVDDNPELLKSFKHTFCSDEIMFPTILMNSPFKTHIVNDDLRYVLWEDRNGNYPANLDTSDLPSILKSNKFFARKFDYPVSLELLKLIESRVIVPSDRK